MRKWLLIARYIISDWRLASAYRRGDVRSRGGSTHKRFTLEQSVDYIDQVFSEYFAFGGITPEQVRGAHILEVGPGDNFGVALRFLAAGAASVTCLDKFYAERDEQHQATIYRALRERLPAAEAEIFDSILRWDNGVAAFDETRLRYVYGVALERAGEALTEASFDLAVSRAVLTEIPEAETAFAVMDRLLKPGGRMLHKIGLGDYDMFSGIGYGPLEFLTIPEFIWRSMASHAGRPNRRRAGFYRRIMDQLGYQARIHIVELAGRRHPSGPGRFALTGIPQELREELALIRPRLDAPFRTFDDEELLVEDIFLDGRKPG